tara:strand:- start:388 stop:1266 length:879 start_codon:yes stop_codon:yes gene_type:complete
MSYVLVTGGAGFVGTNLCKKLVELGETVIALDNYSSGSMANHIPGVHYIHASTQLVSFYTIKYGIPKAVFHLGEYSKVTPSFVDTETVISSNIHGTAQVIEFCKKNNIKLIYSASSTKHSKDGESQSPYAFSKARNVEMIKNYGEWFDLNYAICYFYNNYGPLHDTCNNGWETVISIFEKQKKEGKPLTIVKPGTQRRNYTHVEDTVEGLIASWKREESDEYQLGTEESYNMFELAELFNHPTTLIPSRKGDRMESLIDFTETYEKLNWKPTRTLKQWVEENTHEREINTTS